MLRRTFIAALTALFFVSFAALPAKADAAADIAAAIAANPNGGAALEAALAAILTGAAAGEELAAAQAAIAAAASASPAVQAAIGSALAVQSNALAATNPTRSEERRVGKGGRTRRGAGEGTRKTRVTTEEHEAALTE